MGKLALLSLSQTGVVRAQVKKVGGVGTPADSCIVDGVVCRKNLAHKRMRKHIANARILMMGGNVEFNRTQSRLASLESLTKQQVLLPAGEGC